MDINHCNIIPFVGGIAIFMYASISAKLHHLLEHNSEFCTHTINVWQFEGI
jgi:hypothetical protein